MCFASCDTATLLIFPGKTTLVNQILTKKDRHRKNIVVIENEFGSISIDHQLIEYVLMHAISWTSSRHYSSQINR